MDNRTQYLIAGSLLVGFLAGCSSMPTHEGEPQSKFRAPVVETGTSNSANSLPKAKPTSDLKTAVFETLPPIKPVEEGEIRIALLSILENLGESKPGELRLRELEKEVEGIIGRFQGERRRWFQRALFIGQKYMPMIHALFKERKIPVEMAWLAMIESGFEYGIKSHAGARGIWQFMPGTARDYGLEVSKRRDDRIDPYQATLAAREYLLDMVAVYGSDSFLLVAASYNAGEGRVRGALRRIKDPFARRTFMDVRRYLAKETRKYVPQLLAAAIIGSDPERYGFILDRPGKYHYLQLSNRKSLQELASSVGTSVAALRQMNPEITSRAKKTPVNNFILRVPAEVSGPLLVSGGVTRWQMGQPRPDINILVASASEEQVPAQPKAATSTQKKRWGKPKKLVKKIKWVKVPAGRYINYQVQRGNRLSDVAYWFAVSQSQILAWNSKVPRNGQLKIGQNLKIYGLPKATRKTQHKVISGESLWTIAGLYGVDIRRLSAWNGVGNGTIHPGQKLVVYYSKQDRVGATDNKTRKVSYTVQSGNYLAGIAELFKVKVQQIKRWNNLASGRIYVGQKLQLYLPAKIKAYSYRVKRGDTLSGIAKRFGVSLRTLKYVNGIRQAKSIRAGQNLVYYRV